MHCRLGPVHGSIVGLGTYLTPFISLSMKAVVLYVFAYISNWPDTAQAVLVHAYMCRVCVHVPRACMHVDVVQI